MTTRRIQRVVFGKVQYCGGEELPYGLSDAQRQTLLVEIQKAHPKAKFAKGRKNLVEYGDWVDGTEKQQAQYKLRVARVKQQRAAKKLRIARLKEQDFIRLVAKANKLGYQLVPIAQ